MRPAGYTASRTKRVLAAGWCAAALLGAAACGSPQAAASGTAGGSVRSPGASATTDDPGADLVGAGCADYTAQVPSGPGSIDGMVRDSAATAANNNPLLTVLTKAVSGRLNAQVNLVDELNGGRLTVFAPVDSAFAKLPSATLAALSRPSGVRRLTTILRAHVVSGQLAPAKVDGTRTTLAGTKVTVKGVGDDITVNGATVVCGGLRNANATVYLIDSVLDPAGGHF